MSFLTNSSDDLMKNKTKKISVIRSVIILLLILLLISFLFFLYMQFRINSQLLELQKEYSQIQEEYMQLRDDYSQMQEEYLQLRDDHSQIQEEYSLIQNDYSLLLLLEKKYIKLSGKICIAFTEGTNELIEPWNSNINIQNNNLLDEKKTNHNYDNFFDNNISTNVGGNLEGNTISLEESFRIFWLLLILIFLTIAHFIYYIIYQNISDNKIKKYYDNKIQKSYTRGFANGLKESVIALNEDISILRNFTIWLYFYTQTKHKGKNNENRNTMNDDFNQIENQFIKNEKNITQVDSAACLLKNFLERMESRLGLHQVGEIYSTVNYNLEKFRTYESDLKPNEQVFIIEPGWKFSDEIISKPLVGRGNGTIEARFFKH